MNELDADQQFTTVVADSGEMSPFAIIIPRMPPPILRCYSRLPDYHNMSI